MSHPSSTVHILHLISGLGIGGAERSLQQLVMGLDPARFRSSVLSLGEQGAVGGELAASGVSVTALGLPTGGAALWGVRRLARLLHELRPDLVQTWMYHADLMGTLAAGRRRAFPLVWNVRGGVQSWRDLGVATGIVVRLCALASHQPDVVVVNSESGRQEHAGIGYRPRAWRLIHNGVDLERFRFRAQERRAARQALQADEGRVVFGVLGRYHSKKRVPEVVEAFAGVHAKEPRALLALAGAGMDPDNVDLLRSIRRRGLEAAVRLQGPTGEPRLWLNGIDVLISASVSEGFPNAVAEAMACQVPCIATDVGDTRLLVGEAGLVVPPGDGEALLQAMKETIAWQEGGRRRIGERARRRVEEAYGVDRMIEAYQSLYTELAARPGVAG